ncbi:LADA_0B08592g1_1 [Lachancea dasiensis]|uniref:LADA_0B08592g1_1 n=1 Tax=Lachancea dasiensis TaxID=1072105 RepID=A0A1G4IUD0_9SACH|nr:LADA_0B08592g1_1 [Lachancea dasiensis]
MIKLPSMGSAQRFYSSTVSQDFLKNVLERVKETAARKPASLQPRPRSKGPRRYRGELEAKGNAKNGPRRNGTGRQGPVTNDSTVATSTGSNSTGFNANKQRHFKRKSASASPSAAGEEGTDSSLMEALDSAQNNGVQNSLQNRQTTKRNRAPRTPKRSIPGLGQKTTSTEGIIAQTKKSPVSQQYILQEPTPLGLLKYTPKLAHTKSSRMNAYGVLTLQDSDFPLNRHLNLGVVSSISDKKPVNVSLSPETPSFGHYTPASSLIWRKEKLFTSHSVSPNKPYFESSVSGNYTSLPAKVEKDFDAIANNNNKRKTKLVQNSEIVRLSLERSSLDAASKDLIYNVCSGLKPVSELKA